MLASLAATVYFAMDSRSSDSFAKEAAPPENLQKNLEAYDNWAFFLISKENPLPAGYSVELAEVFQGHYMDERAAPFAVKMLEEARREGINLNVISSYRDVETQRRNFDNYANRLIEEGYAPDEAIALTARQIAYPGASEHNAGLAIDILTENWWDSHDSINAAFAETDEFRWLMRNSWRFGFILRYPEGKENITGFDYEPWHYRFIGVYRAESLYYSGLCLEEYMEVLSLYNQLT